MNRGLGAFLIVLKRSPMARSRDPSTDEIFMREYIREWKRLM